MESTLTDDTFDRHTDDNGSLSTLGSVDTHGLIQTDKVSSSSKAKFLWYKQKMKQEMKITHLENIQEQLRLKAQVTALEAQLANQSPPGPSTDPAGPWDNGKNCAKTACTMSDGLLLRLITSFPEESSQDARRLLGASTDATGR